MSSLYLFFLLLRKRHVLNPYVVLIHGFPVISTILKNVMGPDLIFFSDRQILLPVIRISGKCDFCHRHIQNIEKI